jgi:outer membrane protein OmpA-like peptidoglycan-associated protein
VGHADTSGNAIVNKSLSLKRAQCVADYLVSTGVDADKIRVIGRGSREPVASNETSAGRAQNRRVEILVVAEDRALDRILFPGDALFESNSAGLTTEGRTYLEEKRLETRDLLNGATYVEIVGHTDDAGDDNENMVLSKLLATTVRDYLVGQGLDGSKVFTAGKGETMPIASNNTDKGRARNRRVQIFIFGRAGEPPL